LAHCYNRHPCGGEEDAQAGRLAARLSLYRARAGEAEAAQERRQEAEAAGAGARAELRRRVAAGTGGGGGSRPDDIRRLRTQSGQFSGQVKPRTADTALLLDLPPSQEPALCGCCGRLLVRGEGIRRHLASCSYGPGGS
jgi:hypothetical protein